MIPKMSSKYFLLRIVKSKDFIDLIDASSAYMGFLKFRRDYAHSLYCQSISKGNIFGAIEAMNLQLT